MARDFLENYCRHCLAEASFIWIRHTISRGAADYTRTSTDTMIMCAWLRWSVLRGFIGWCPTTTIEKCDNCTVVSGPPDIVSVTQLMSDTLVTKSCFSA